MALQGHQRAVAAQDRGFFADLIVPLDGTAKDHFPRRDTSMEKLGKLKPVFDRTSGRGTLTAGNSSPLTDGAAAIWVATEEGLSRLPQNLPRARLVDFEMAAIDVFTEGLLMAPVSAIPRLLARHGLTYNDIALWEIHEAFSAQVLCHIKALDDKDFVRAKAGVDHTFGSFPRERMNPNGGSVALGHPFAATGARILSQAVKELAALPKGSRAIVSICSDGGLGTVALLENRIFLGTKPDNDLIERRPGPIFRRVRRRADVNKAGDLFVRLEPERVEHATIIGVPFGDPVRAVAERVRGKDERHGGGARREHLLPFGNFRMRAGAAHHGDDQRRAQQPVALGVDMLGLRVRIFGAEGGRDRCPAARAPRPRTR